MALSQEDIPTGVMMFTTLWDPDTLPINKRYLLTSD